MLNKRRPITGGVTVQCVTQKYFTMSGLLTWNEVNISHAPEGQVNNMLIFHLVRFPKANSLI